MNSALAYLPLLLCGAGFYALFFVWRKAAARWSTWFPLLKKVLEFGLIGLAIGLALYTMASVFGEGVSTGPAVLAVVLGLALPELALRSQRKGSATTEETKRGASVGGGNAVAKLVKAQKAPTFLELGGIPVPVSAEPYHFLIAGSTGTGKSVAIGALLDKIRARGDTAIVVDSGGDFASKHFVEGTDFIFNPYDERCVGWSPTGEMQGAWDAQALARSIVPDGVGDSKEWNSYAQTFVGSVLRKLWESNRLTLKDFLYFIQAAPRSELQVLLEDTAAASQLASERTFGSIRTIAGNYVTSYDYLPSDREQFSVSEMIRAEHSGVLFMTYRDDQLDSLRNLMACLLDVAARSILSLEPDANRRVWLIIDEFASIGRVQSIEAVATKARKAGGCLVLGIQSVSQLKDRYGDNGAQTILSCLSTWLVLRCSDADTAEYMSKYIGEAEVRRTQKGQSSSDSGETQSWSEQSATQRVVLGSQIQAFKNLHGLLKLAGDYPVCEVDLPLPPKREVVGKPFEARDFKVRPMLKLAAPAKAKAAASRAAEPLPDREEPSDDAATARSEPAPTVYTDRTPRPRRDAKPVVKNLLLEVSRGQPTMPERVAAALQRARKTQDELRRKAEALGITALSSSSPAPAPTPAKPARSESAPRPERTDRAPRPAQPGKAEPAARQAQSAPDARPTQALPPQPPAPARPKKRTKPGSGRDMLNDLLR